MRFLTILSLVAATLLAFGIAAVTPAHAAPFGEVRFEMYPNPSGASVVHGGKTPDADDCSRAIRGIETVHAQTGVYPRIAMCWINNGMVDPKDPGLFPTDSAQKAFALGVRLMLNVRCDTPARILSGADDAYYRQFATDAKAFGHRIWFRGTGWEANTNDIHNCATWNDPAGYVAGWHHVHQIFDAVGAGNVRWGLAFSARANPAALAPFNVAVQYPADVDELMVDHYPPAGSTAEEDFTASANPIVADLAVLCNMGKMCGVAETGALQANQPAFFASVQAYLAGQTSFKVPPNFDMLGYFDCPGGANAGHALAQWELTPEGAAAYRTLVTTVSPNSTPAP